MTEHEQAALAHLRTAARSVARNDRIGAEVHVQMALESAAKMVAGEAPYYRRKLRFFCLGGRRHAG